MISVFRSVLHAGSFCDDSAGVWSFSTPSTLTLPEARAGGMPFCQMIDGGTHGDQQNACLAPSSAFTFLFLLAGSDLLTFLSNPIKKLSERH